MNYKVLVLIMIVLSIFTLGCIDNQSIQLNRENESTVNSTLIYHSGAQTITRIHDKQMNVTCWFIISGAFTVNPAISCISDNQLK